MTDREFLRHAVATLAYRAAKAVRGAPASFAGFCAAPGTRTPAQLIAHMCDLMDWARSMANGEGKFVPSEPLAWDAECARFFAAVAAFDARLAAPEPLGYELSRLFQAPVADALTHTGQLAMLRHMHGAPMKGESYNRADIVIGRTGAEQTPPDPRFEFD
jgi:hypothetical protein